MIPQITFHLYHSKLGNYFYGALCLQLPLVRVDADFGSDDDGMLDLSTTIDLFNTDGGLGEFLSLNRIMATGL